MTNNQLTENSVTQLLNNVRLARDNAERDDNRVDHSFYYALTRALEELHERRKAASEPVAYLVCNGHLYQDRAFMSPLMAEESVKNRNDGAEIKALCVCGKAECAE